MYIACNSLTYNTKGISWVGKRCKHTIRSCLDRVIVNGDWETAFPNTESELLKLYGSDHRLVIKTIYSTPSKRRKMFHYDKLLLHCDDFWDNVAKGWNESGPAGVRGYHYTN